MLCWRMPSLTLNRPVIPPILQSLDYRVICLLGVCVIYALFGSPTPERLGPAELAVAGLLAVSIGTGCAYDTVFRPAAQHFWQGAGRIFLIYGLCVPLIGAVAAGHDMGAIMRDLLPFLFLFLPLFLAPLFRAQPACFRVLFAGVLIIGFVFALRALVMRFMRGCAFWCAEDLLYLENMPTVLYAALILTGAALQGITRKPVLKNTALSGLYAAAALIPLAAMAVTLQRASLGAVLLYAILIQGVFLYRYPVRALIVTAAGVATLLAVHMAFSPVLWALWEKTQKVGLNMRPQEFAAVWDIVTRDPLTFFFGIGWGGQFRSPAVGGLSVNFTHNFFSFLLLKTGMTGFLCAAAYMAGLLERLSRIVLKNPVTGLALALPVMIDLTLYASFKSLDFGLMLLMIPGALLYLRQSGSESF